MSAVRRAVRLPPGSPGRSPMVARSRRPHPLGPTFTVSLALHLGVLVLLLVGIERRQALPEMSPPADFAMVFEGHSPTRNSGPNPELVNPPRPGSPAPGASVPPVPAVPPAVPPAPAQAAAPPAPPTPQAAPRAPPSPPAPQVAPASPAVPAPAQPAPPVAMAIPPPPPPAPHPEVQMPRTAPPRRAEQQPERQRAPAFPAPLAFSFGTPGTVAPRAPEAESRLALAPRAHPGRPGTIDLSFGPIVGGSEAPSSSVQMEGVSVSTDWLNMVTAWWQRHSYYPPEAGLNNESGDVTLHMRVGRDGRVSQLELVGRSGSQWLDMGALSVFRDATLPPLPSDMPEAQIPFHVTIHYVIIR